MTLNNKTNILTIQNLMLCCRVLREKIICRFVKPMWSRSFTGEGHIVFSKRIEGPEIDFDRCRGPPVLGALTCRCNYKWYIYNSSSRHVA